MCRCVGVSGCGRSFRQQFEDVWLVGMLKLGVVKGFGGPSVL